MTLSITFLQKPGNWSIFPCYGPKSRDCTIINNIVVSFSNKLFITIASQEFDHIPFKSATLYFHFVLLHKILQINIRANVMQTSFMKCPQNIQSLNRDS